MYLSYCLMQLLPRVGTAFRTTARDLSQPQFLPILMSLGNLLISGFSTGQLPPRPLKSWTEKATMLGFSPTGEEIQTFFQLVHLLKNVLCLLRTQGKPVIVTTEKIPITAPDAGFLGSVYLPAAISQNRTLMPPIQWGISRVQGFDPVCWLVAQAGSLSSAGATNCVATWKSSEGTEAIGGSIRNLKAQLENMDHCFCWETEAHGGKPAHSRLPSSSMAKSG